MPVLLTPVHAAATRRQFLALLGASGVATACGSPDTAPADPTTEPVVGGYGPVDVPTSPRRVITMINNDTDRAPVLGLPLVGAYASATGAPFPGHQADRLVDVPSVGTYDLNIEEIAALAPDLVVYGEVGGYLDQGQYDALSAVAPIYSFDPTLRRGPRRSTSPSRPCRPPSPCSPSWVSPRPRPFRPPRRPGASTSPSRSSECSTTPTSC